MIRFSIFLLCCATLQAVEPADRHVSPVAPDSRPTNTSARPVFVKADWSKVNRTGFVKTLVTNSEFLQLHLDLREESDEKISLETMKELLDLPVVKNHVADFVKEALLGDSYLYFNFANGDYDAIMNLILTRLAKNNEDEVAQAFIEGVTQGNALKNLLFRSMYSRAKENKDNSEASNDDFAPLIQHLSSATKVTVRHTTRSVAPVYEEKSPVDGFEVFQSGRFGVTFEDSQGVTKYIVLQTEALAGHLQPINPGKTKVGGHISESSSENFDDSRVFSSSDTRQLLKELVKAWGTPSTIRDRSKKLVLNAVAAIYADGDAEKLKSALNIK